MKVVTTATGSAGYFPALRESCKGLDFVVLGAGQKWRGFTWRWTLLENYLRTLDPAEIVVHVDAYDVISTGKSAKDIEARFESYGKDILLSVETKPPNLMMRYVYDRMFDSCVSTHVNGGCYAGRAGALLEMISTLRETFHFSDNDDDQQLLAKLCATPFFREKCALDVDSRVFCNVWAPETISQGQVVWDASTVRDTCFVHAPANADMTQVLKYYGISSGVGGKVQRRGFFDYTVKGAITYAKYLWPEYLAGSVCILCILFALFRGLKKRGVWHV